MPTQIKTRIEVEDDGQIRVRESKIFTDDDGEVYPAKHHSIVIDVDDDVDTKPFKYGPDVARIKAIRDAVHTPEVVAARRAARAAQEANNG
ncbi:MAG: hypothetical protein ACYTEQ_30640 [Planctomycetota bacterium]|jgi:hypothetical protein